MHQQTPLLQKELQDTPSRQADRGPHLGRTNHNGYHPTTSNDEASSRSPPRPGSARSLSFAIRTWDTSSDRHPISCESAGPTTCGASSQSRSLPLQAIPVRSTPPASALSMPQPRNNGCEHSYLCGTCTSKSARKSKQSYTVKLRPVTGLLRLPLYTKVFEPGTDDRRLSDTGGFNTYAATRVRLARSPAPTCTEPSTLNPEHRQAKNFFTVSSRMRCFSSSIPSTPRLNISTSGERSRSVGAAWKPPAPSRIPHEHETMVDGDVDLAWSPHVWIELTKYGTPLMPGNCAWKNTRVQRYETRENSPSKKRSRI